MARTRAKLSPRARQRLVLRWLRVYMGGIYVLSLGVALVAALAAKRHGWDYPAFMVCLLGLAFPPVAAARGTSTMPDLPPLSARQLSTLKRLAVATAALVSADIVLYEATSGWTPAALWAATVVAGTASAFYSLAALIG